jgi:hypothetical protein
VRLQLLHKKKKKELTTQAVKATPLDTTAFEQCFMIVIKHSAQSH